jgi:hypothetical protein
MINHQIWWFFRFSNSSPGSDPQKKEANLGVAYMRNKVRSRRRMFFPMADIQNMGNPLGQYMTNGSIG